MNELDLRVQLLNLLRAIYVIRVKPPLTIKPHEVLIGPARQLRALAEHEHGERREELIARAEAYEALTAGFEARRVLKGEAQRKRSKGGKTVAERHRAEWGPKREELRAEAAKRWAKNPSLTTEGNATKLASTGFAGFTSADRIADAIRDLSPRSRLKK